jgi:hypothetical protein
MTWVPEAFAQRVLASTTFLDDYTDGSGHPRRMSEDVVFDAVRRYARAVEPTAAIGIAERSAAMNAARATSPDGDANALALLAGRTALALTTPFPPIEDGDGGVPEARSIFSALVAAHGHTLTATLKTAMRAGELELDAHVVRHAFGAPFRAQFDFVVKTTRLAGGTLVESFAGDGPTYRAALEQACGKFERASLHVILASLLDRASCADQVSWETWPNASGAFDACLGPQLLLWADVSAPIGPLVDALRERLAQQPLSREVHTLRLFAARDGSKVLADEVLLDGEPWEPGIALCAAYAWPERGDAWATRLFLMLTPRSEPPERSVAR